MATTRIKDISSTVTSLASDDYIAVDGATNGTRKMARGSIYTDVAAAFTGAPTTYDICPLNSGTGKIDATYLPTSGDTPKGEWNASTNSPSLIDGTGTAGDYYDVTTAGSQDLGSGSITFTVGDVVKYNGSTWYKIDSVANFLDGYSTAATSRAALEVNSVDEDAEATGTKLVGPALYFDGSNDYLEVSDSSKLTFSSSAEFGTNSSGTWSPDDNTPALTDGTGTLNQHYRVDSGAGTVTQGASTLSIINSTATTAGQAVYYDGSVWRLKDVDDLPLSVSAWVKASDWTNFGIAGKYSSPTSAEWLFYTATDDLAFYLNDSNSSNRITCRTSLPMTAYENEWVHVAVTYGGSGPNSANAFTSADSAVKIFVNGSEVAQDAVEKIGTYTGMQNTNVPLHIGRFGTAYAKGHIKDVKLYNRSLTATEVAQLARGTDLGFADEWAGALGGVYTQDATPSGEWTGVNATDADEAGPIGGKSNVLKLTSDNTSNPHYMSLSTGASAGKRYRIEFLYRIPSGQSNVDGITVDVSNELGVYTSVSPSTDTWIKASFEIVGPGANMNVFMTDGGNKTFTDAGGDDLLYIAECKITEIGTLADFRAENFIADKLIDQSSNNFVGTNNGATLVGGRKALQLDTDGAAAGNNVLSIYNGSSHLAYLTDKGDLNANSISSGASTELTIATGAVTATKSYHTIDTESDAASDDLDTISGGRAGQMLIVQANNSARSVVLKDGTGNLKLSGDITLDNAEDTATLVSDGTSWYLIATSNNGA